MGTYLAQVLKASGGQIGVAYETQAIGAIIAPFIVGLLADKYFDAQKILGFLHIVGAGLMFMAAQGGDFASFYPYILIYMVLYMPTLALVNSISFNQMEDTTKEFANVRVWGTIGWIAAGMLIGYLLNWEAKSLLKNTFYLAAGTALFLGLFSFTLPKTPPRSKGETTSIRDILGLDALALLKDKNYLTFFVASILICIPLAFYYSNGNLFLNEVGMKNAAGNMSLGQVSEVLFMLLLPLFVKRFGIKTTLLVGMLAWVLRYILFAYGDAGSSVWMLFLGIVLHGICYDFFFVSGQIYTDFKAGEKIKSSAQGLITLATYGLGMLIGFRLAGMITDQYALVEAGHDWYSIWIIPAAIAAGVGILTLLIFRNEKIRV